jgi:hypothetical protein
MTSTTTMRRWWADDLCQSGRMTPTDILGHQVRVNHRAVDAFRALNTALTHTGYQPGASIGVYNCRNITGSTKWSLHAYGLAVDIDPQLNPYTGGLFSWQRTAFTSTDIEAVEGIRTTTGLPVWSWGGWWTLKHDYMHFQLAVPPGFQVDWGTIPGGDDMAWKQPGDAVEDAADGAAALRYMGGFDLSGVPNGLLQPLGVIADTLMLHDQRLRGGGPLPDHTHTPGRVQQ